MNSGTKKRVSNGAKLISYSMIKTDNPYSFQLQRYYSFFADNTSQHSFGNEVGAFVREHYYKSPCFCSRKQWNFLKIRQNGNSTKIGL